MTKRFSINHYHFDSDIEKRIFENHRDHLAFPLVYFINDQKQKDAYVGETTDVVNRMKTHLKTKRKQSLTSVDLIISDLFNKSATLDVESNLIRYLHADGQFNLQNGNLGIANHQYYQQKEVYWEMFKEIWNELRSLGIARNPLEYIDNSDLFKYSPYKSLSTEQVASLKLILECLLDEKTKTTLIHGGAGTGKSILAIFLFKLLKTDLKDFNFADFEEQDMELLELLKMVKSNYGDLSMALVIPVPSFRKTITRVFKNIKGLSTDMVISPSRLSEQKYDLIIVDEGHRLRQRKNLSNYNIFDVPARKIGLEPTKTTELEWVLLQSKKALIFYDQFQSIKPTDVPRTEFLKLESNKTTRIERLYSQHRSKGGRNLVDFLHNLLDSNSNKLQPFKSNKFELKLYDEVDDLAKDIKAKNKIHGLSRMIAGFAWEWISKKDRTKYDIQIGESLLQWNSTEIEWVNSKNSINEVGCIHTTQGYDLNYVGVIIGPELDYDFESKKMIVFKDRYKDKSGKNTVNDEEILKNYILNIYKTILLRGIQGTFIYACNENLRAYLAQYIPVKTKTESKPPLRIIDAPNELTVPLYDLEIAAGSFSEQQRVESIRYVELTERKANMQNYFACKVVGESMNQIIPNGSICLFEKYDGGTRNGKITLVELTDYSDPDSGSNYTIKDYTSKKTTTEDGWQHEEITLLPRSTENYEIIVLRDDETVGLKVIGVFVKLIH